MADPDRRNLGPEPPLTLGERRPAAPRRGGPAPITLILSLIVLLGAAGGVVWLYRGGARHAGDAPEPVGAPLSDVREAAPPQSQPADQAAGLAIYKDGEAASGSPTFAPPPEQPGPRPEPAPPAATQPPPPPPSHATAAQGDALGALIDRSTAPPPRAAPVRTVAAPPPPPPARPERLARNDGGVEVQIGAFSSQALADHAWSGDAAVAPGPMAGKGKAVSAIDRDGQTLYRTSITGFSSREEAQALCDRLKAAGRTCFVR